MEKGQRDLLLAFNEQQVKFLVVGGYALGRYTEPHVTKDLDIFVEISEDNAQRVFAALAAYGAPLAGYTPKDFQDPYSGYQFGFPPSQIESSPSALCRSKKLGKIASPDKPGMAFQSATSRLNTSSATRKPPEGYRTWPTRQL
jgi:hypothetical protein